MLGKKLKKGDTLRLVLYTTDFEITIRDNTDYHLTVDLAQSNLEIPFQREVTVDEQSRAKTPTHPSPNH
mgnify:FL=1